ncbi:MAG TPA: protein kinase [Pyrinomonadaceae bacterium]|nr:protein kinase [Pyrinomonadaceae bacterium]
MDLPPGTHIGRYKIQSLLGTGGMGQVYLAQDTQLNRAIALKILPSGVAADKQRMGRFIQEAKAASSLNHPNILTIYEIGQSDSIHFMATELIDGETLRQRMAKTLKLTEAIEVAIQVASALAAAHEAGVVHRDIKPENIMVRRDGYVKVLDFGLAKLIQHQPDRDATTLVNTDPGIIMGTVNYMSPEQTRGLETDARTDIWSLGVVIYEMVAARLPFQGATATDTIISIIEREPAHLGSHTTEVPAQLERIVRKALAKERDERYQTVKDLALDLKALKRELEIEAELGRSIAPNLKAAQSQSKTVSEPTKTVPLPKPLRTSSDADEARRYVRNAIVLTALAAIAALSYFVYARYYASGSDVIDSIAVLPFTNDSGDPEHEYLSDGISESLINNLSQLPQLKVIARSSSFRFKGKNADPQEVAKALGVRAILNGRLARRGDRLQISAELIDTRDQRQVWGEQYNRSLSDILTVQEEIARDISEKLRLRLSGEERERLTKRQTRNSEAYQAYIQGRYFWNKRSKESLEKGIEYFNQAIEKDPNYALAYAGLADSYIILGNFGMSPPKEAYPKARAAATKALEIDDALAEAHVSLAFTKHLFEWDWPSAERDFKRALELNPNYGPGHQWYGVSLAARGRTAEAIAAAKRAQETDPLSLTINAVVGWMFFFARQYDQTIDQEKKTLEMDPNFALAHRYLGMAYEQKGMYKEAIAEFQKTADGSDEELLLGELGHAYAAFGKHSEAREVLNKMKELSQQRYFPPFEMALIHAALDEKDQAFALLEKSYEDRYPWLIHLRVDPRLDPLRSDPRFDDLVRRVERS